jgi:superfamily II DNA or RNA helicase
MTYTEFIAAKKQKVSDAGFEVADLHEGLFPFQKDCVKTALKKGRFAIFADCGLGKTFMQLEWSQKVVEHTGRPVLILAPLAVSGQTVEEGKKFGYTVSKVTDIPTINRYDLPAGIYITNYEQLNNIDPQQFAGIVLDESSILKNFEGAIRTQVINDFANTPYKLACTATPSPNDPMELGNHAEFLNVMSRQEMLAMYFIHDGGETAKWRLKKHSHKVFWQWVKQWAVVPIPPPEFILPPLNLIEKQIITDKRDNGQLFNDVAISATNFNAELRITKIQRLTQVAEIVNNSKENFVIWVKQNEEGEELRRLIPEAIEVKGSDDPDWKEEMLLGFAQNKFRILITKAKIAQFGLNYQNCHNTIFASPDFSFEAMYQSIRRFLRFRQEHTVNAWLITTDTMQNVIQSFKRKQDQFDEMQRELMEEMNDAPQSKVKLDRFGSIQGDGYLIQRGDCVELIKTVADESIGFSIFSPPFAELYTYSDLPEDMGNSRDYNEFLFAFKFLVKDLFRVMWSGRNVAVHCMDLPIQKGKEGYIGLRDFSNMIRTAFEDAGFIYHSRVTIWKDPVVEMQRTKALGLLHKQVKKDAAMSRVGLPDYLLVFRKPGEHEHPVKCDIPVDLWQKYASPVWYDIDYGDTLNGRAGRDEKDEKHICPLQLPTIERAIHLWANKGDTVLTPFMGIGSEVYQALLMDRKAIGFELKHSYFNLAAKNCRIATEKKMQLEIGGG